MPICRLPCRHFCCCYTCALALRLSGDRKRCPMCRSQAPLQLGALPEAFFCWTETLRFWRSGSKDPNLPPEKHEQNSLLDRYGHTSNIQRNWFNRNIRFSTWIPLLKHPNWDPICRGHWRDAPWPGWRAPAGGEIIGPRWAAECDGRLWRNDRPP